jgi:colicin import membrane protein
MNCMIRKEPRLGSQIFVSLLCHLVIGCIIYTLGSPSDFRPKENAYYVDIVNLPVANPRSGASAPPEREQKAARPASEQMSVPREVAKKTEKAQTKKPETAAKTQKTQKKTEPTEESSEEFNRRLARLQQKADARHQSAALDSIRKKAQGARGIPGGTGTEAGSDYASYVRSRLRDAFEQTIAYQSGNPEVVVKLRINRQGRVIGYRVEKTSHDRLFEAAVGRAIDQAGENLPPPPGGNDFEGGFIFRPQGVKKK